MWINNADNIVILLLRIFKCFENERVKPRNYDETHKTECTSKIIQWDGSVYVHTTKSKARGVPKWIQKFLENNCLTEVLLQSKYDKIAFIFPKKWLNVRIYT